VVLSEGTKTTVATAGTIVLQNKKSKAKPPAAKKAKKPKDKDKPKKPLSGFNFYSREVRQKITKILNNEPDTDGILSQEQLQLLKADK